MFEQAPKLRREPRVVETMALEFHAVAGRLRTADKLFVIEPYLRVAGQPDEQWTMFLTDPAGNALEFKTFAEDADVFAASV
jgi:extradiol dioxygenase family protein